jgi:membrane protease YdiL (CAAX protease family)
MLRTAKPTPATYAGIFCALGIPLLIFPSRFLQTLNIRSAPLIQESLLWGLTAFVLCILVFWERLPLSAIGLGRPSWKSLLWGFAAAIAIRVGVGLVIVLYTELSGGLAVRDFAHDIGTATNFGQLPFAALVFLALRAGITEEILFRGYGIERLSAVIGNRGAAALISLAIFTLAHLGLWDLRYLILVFPTGVILTLLYLWRHDLWANIFAHFLTDATSLFFAYAIAHHLIDVKSIAAA